MNLFVRCVQCFIQDFKCSITFNILAADKADYLIYGITFKINIYKTIEIPLK